MNPANGIKIDNFLHDIQSLSEEKFTLLVSIKKIFNEAHAGLVEDIKYGGLVFSLSNTLVGGIYVYEKHLSIEFSHGAELSDLDHILEGKGKKRRHIKIYSMSDISEKKVGYFVR
ncbi:MAG: DUF1801 domain-containing protein [Gammaproteobacteria bacterium]|nr:DUF1801 domain-containing protein [Gammaproteobacteria bacterium]MCF6260062.1 DUF1801 domain-containing protein [Gammaproteobacteria bacterium]